jgi:hypothetical protein
LHPARPSVLLTCLCLPVPAFADVALDEVDEGVQALVGAPPPVFRLAVAFGGCPGEFAQVSYLSRLNFRHGQQVGDAARRAVNLLGQAANGFGVAVNLLR